MNNRLEKLRKSHDINQEELATALGVTRQTISSLESGRYNPSIILAFKIARYFDTTIEEIFIYERDHNENKSFLILLICGGVLVILGIVSGLTDFKFWGIPFIRMDLVPIGISFLGSMILLIGVGGIMNARYKTQTEKILENDERVIIIFQKAKSKAFDLMFMIFPISVLTLTILGYMNFVSFLSLLGIFLICLVYFLYNIVKLEKKYSPKSCKTVVDSRPTRRMGGYLSYNFWNNQQFISLSFFQTTKTSPLL